MRFKTALLVFATVGVMTGCGEQSSTPAQGQAAPASAVSKGPSDPNLLASIHFLGSTALLADKKAAKLNEISSLPESADLLKDVLDKLATAPYRFLREHEKSPATASDQAALVRPLLDDLLHQESYTEVRGPTNPWPEMILTIHLSNDRAALWRSNLATILTTWTGLPVSQIQAEGYSGWELKKHHPPNLARFIQAGDWVVFGVGQDAIAGLPALLGKIKSGGRPASALSDHWLEAWADLPRLLGAQSPLPTVKMPTLQLALGLKDDNVRTHMVLHFPEPLKLTLPAWNLPTNLLRAPLDSFTVVRGYEHLVDKTDAIKRLQLSTIPNQITIWAMPEPPFETCAATPVANGPSFVDQLGSSLVTLENPTLIAYSGGQLAWDPDHRTLRWQNGPLISPYLTSITTNKQTFAVAGLFPPVPGRSAVPATLYAQVIGHTNQVYYDWDNAGERASQWWNMLTIYNILTHKIINNGKGPIQPWLTAIKKQITDCATEIVWNAPNELTLTRRSAIGLSSVEIAGLLYFEGAPNFPLHVEYPTRPIRRPTTPNNGQGSPTQPKSPPAPQTPGGPSRTAPPTGPGK